MLRTADALQLLGDGLLAAIAQEVEGALALGLTCAAMLRSRDWSGDDDLAELLERLVGRGPTPVLRPLPVDLEELANILEGDLAYGGGRIDRLTGEVWPLAAIDYAREMGEEDEDESDNSERWLWVECEGSHDAYNDMKLFIGTVEDVRTADRLARAVEGHGAFQSFKDVLVRRPEDLDRWFAYSEERQRGRARAWLARAGYCSMPASHD
jgi:hypothetical protein